MTDLTPGQKAHRTWLQERWPDMTEVALAKELEIGSDQFRHAWEVTGSTSEARGRDGERERITGLFAEWITIMMAEPNGWPPEAWIAGFADLIALEPKP